MPNPSPIQTEDDLKKIPINDRDAHEAFLQCMIDTQRALALPPNGKIEQWIIHWGSPGYSLYRRIPMSKDFTVFATYFHEPLAWGPFVRAMNKHRPHFREAIQCANKAVEPSGIIEI